MKLIAICGMAGSGKSTVRELFTKKGFSYVKLGVTEMVIEKYGKTTEELENKVRVEVRQELGMDAMAQIVIPKIDKLLEEGKDVVIDNMYSWSEYKTFKNKYGTGFITLAVLANPQLRYERLAQRKDDPRDFSDHNVSKQRDYREIEMIEKGGPIAMADYYIVNEKSEDNLKDKIEQVYQQIMQR